MKTYLLLASLLLFSLKSSAQITEHSAWLFITHQQKLSKKFDLLADVQLRSANRLNYLTTLLLRTGLSYNLSTQHSVALGYAYKGDWEQEDGMTSYIPENRIFEQYRYDFKFYKVEMMFRARLEQRFVKESNVAFSQRARGFISAQIPIVADSAFNKGLYAGIQNELFMNIQHKDRVNQQFLDQNRSMVSIGYRWNKHIDTELGYQFWYQPEADNTFRRNILQLMFTTQF